MQTLGKILSEYDQDMNTTLNDLLPKTTEVLKQAAFQPITSSDFILKASREYALYVCQDRAIPNVTDGLKHVQRMALWLLRNKQDKIKTVALGGELAASKVYVHGDVPANNAISLLCAPYKNNVPLIEGHGAFGNRLYPGLEGIGAPRYTEVKRCKAAEALLYRDLDVVPLEDNYDGSTKQPKHFLPLIPLVLLNGISGIAVGWSTNILPHDLKTLIKATKAAITNKPIEPILPFYSKYNCSITNIGLNKWELTGHCEVKDNVVYITELPPGLDIEAFRKRLIEMENSDEIRDFIDRSTDCINIQVKLNRPSILDDEPSNNPTNEAEAISFFKLRERITERIVVIDWNGNSIRVYEQPEDLIKDFVGWRLGWYTKRYEHYTKRDSYELNYWKGLENLFNCGFSKKLGTFANKTAMQDFIRTQVETLDDQQIERLVNLPTHKWTSEFKTEIQERVRQLEADLADYVDIMASPERLRKIYLSELDEIKL